MCGKLQGSKSWEGMWYEDETLVPRTARGLSLQAPQALSSHSPLEFVWDCLDCISTVAGPNPSRPFLLRRSTTVQEALTVRVGCSQLRGGV